MCFNCEMCAQKISRIQIPKHKIRLVTDDWSESARLFHITSICYLYIRYFFLYYYFDADGNFLWLIYVRCSILSAWWVSRGMCLAFFFIQKTFSYSAFCRTNVLCEKKPRLISEISKKWFACNSLDNASFIGIFFSILCRNNDGNGNLCFF